jgi:hypothetical protein
MISMISVVSTASRVDFLIIPLLLRGSPTSGLKESSPGLGGLNAYISDCEQIGHCFWLLHGYRLQSPNIVDPVSEGIDDFDVLDVWDRVLSIAKMFYVVPKALIMLLPNAL